MTVFISKERLGGGHVTGEFCARLQREMSPLSEAKDGQRRWVATGSWKKASPLVSGISFAHSLISALALRKCGGGSWACLWCNPGQPWRIDTDNRPLLFSSPPELQLDNGGVREALSRRPMGKRLLFRWTILVRRAHSVSSFGAAP